MDLQETKTILKQEMDRRDWHDDQLQARPAAIVGRKEARFRSGGGAK